MQTHTGMCHGSAYACDVFDSNAFLPIPKYRQPNKLVCVRHSCSGCDTCILRVCMSMPFVVYHGPLEIFSLCIWHSTLYLERGTRYARIWRIRRRKKNSLYIFYTIKVRCALCCVYGSDDVISSKTHTLYLARTGAQAVLMTAEHTSHITHTRRANVLYRNKFACYGCRRTSVWSTGTWQPSPVQQQTAAVHH